MMLKKRRITKLFSFLLIVTMLSGMPVSPVFALTVSTSSLTTSTVSTTPTVPAASVAASAPVSSNTTVAPSLSSSPLSQPTLPAIQTAPANTAVSTASVLTNLSTVSVSTTPTSVTPASSTTAISNNSTGTGSQTAATGAMIALATILPPQPPAVPDFKTQVRQLRDRYNAIEARMFDANGNPLVDQATLSLLATISDQIKIMEEYQYSLIQPLTEQIAEINKAADSLRQNPNNLGMVKDYLDDLADFLGDLITVVDNTPNFWPGSKSTLQAALGLVQAAVSINNANQMINALTNIGAALGNALQASAQNQPSFLQIMNLLDQLEARIRNIVMPVGIAANPIQGGGVVVASSSSSTGSTATSTSVSTTTTSVAFTSTTATSNNSNASGDQAEEEIPPPYDDETISDKEWVGSGGTWEEIETRERLNDDGTISDGDWVGSGGTWEEEEPPPPFDDGTISDKEWVGSGGTWEEDPFGDVLLNPWSPEENYISVGGDFGADEPVFSNPISADDAFVRPVPDAGGGDFTPTKDDPFIVPSTGQPFIGFIQNPNAPPSAQK